MSKHVLRSIAAIAAAVPVTVIALASVASASDDHDGDRDRTTIYTQTNATAANSVLAFQRINGELTNVATYPTGGLGAGSGLGSQGSVVADDGRLIAVNAGSNEITLFRVNERGALKRTDVEPTGGVRPVSVTIHDDTVYVLNAGNQTVNGFRIRNGSLVAILGSLQTLPGNGGAQIQFDRDGRRLVVTEKATNTIDVLPVRRGVAGPAVSNASAGQTPFGFAIDKRNHVIVSNAAGGAPGASSLSSYGFTGPSAVTPISATVATTQTAACWVVLSKDNRFAFTTNTGSGSVSSYAVGADGSLTLRQAVAASTGAGPIDMIVDGDVLFTLNSGAHTITGHGIADDGTLSNAGQVIVPTGVTGLASA